MTDFAKLLFDEASNDRLFDFCKTHRLGLADVEDQSSLAPKDFKFHLTVMYSRVENPLFEVGEREIDPLTVETESFDLFGPGNDLLVLRLKQHPDLSAMFEHYRETYGHVYDFPVFRPHVTIKGSSAGVRHRIGSIPLPDFPLLANRLEHKIKR